MQFIEERLRVVGVVNRRDLMERFGISAPQAANDFRKFMAHRPKAMVYNKTRKAYVRAPEITGGRDCRAAARSLIQASDDWLKTVAHRDPDMIRDVAAALIATEV